MGGAPNPPSAPKFYPINIADTLQKAIEFDVQGYADSDAYFAQKFPGLVAARQQTIQDAYQQLTGPLDPTVQHQFTESAITRALQTTGGGNSAQGLDTGSVGQNVAGVNIAQQILAKQDSDRSYLQSLIDQNPQRAIGLSGDDALALLAYNQKGGNIAAQQQYATTLAGINAQGQYGVQIGNAISGIGGTIGGLSTILSKSDVRLKKNIEIVGISPSGIPIVEFEYIEHMGLPEGRFRGVLAQDVLQFKPEAVEYHEDGYMTVDYSQLDVKHERIT